MFKGAQLQLLVGPAVAVPAPKEVVRALTQVVVRTGTAGPSVFELTFDLAAQSTLQTLFLASAGSAIPMIRVILVVSIHGRREVLIDGVMTSHQISDGTTPGTTAMTVIGEDLSRVLDYIDFSGLPYPAMPIFARVNLILAKYAFLGIVPKVIPSVLLDVPNPISHIPSQTGKDLEYLQALANEVGYVFYMEPGSQPGTSFAYWGPAIKAGAPQAALSVNMDAHSNVESLSFSYDSEKKTLPVVYIQNEQTKLPIPIAVGDITPLSPPLGAVPPIPKSISPVKQSAKYGPVRGAMIAMAKAAQSDGAVKATGSLDVQRYGHVLKPRRLVGVRGAGPAFNGLYHVDSVTHQLSRGVFKQSFDLSRNGVVSTVAGVSP